MKTIRFEDVPVNTIFYHNTILYDTVLEYIKIIRDNTDNNAISINGEIKGRLLYFFSDTLVQVENIKKEITFNDISLFGYFIYQDDLCIKVYVDQLFMACNLTKQTYTEIFEESCVIPVKNVQFTYEI